MYLIVICEVDYFIQAVMGPECPMCHIEPAFTLIKQPLEVCLADARSLPDIKFSKHLCRLMRWTKDRPTPLRDGVVIYI
jgi:hypothetical protein